MQYIFCSVTKSKNSESCNKTCIRYPKLQLSHFDLEKESFKMIVIILKYSKRYFAGRLKRGSVS